MAARAAPKLVPLLRASHSAASAKPAARWAPQSAARRAARTRTDEESFSAAPSFSTMAAQSEPEYSSGSKPRSDWQRDSAAATMLSDTALLHGYA